VRLGEGTPAEAHATRQVLAYVLERSLRLLHPFMPFVTEAIWRNLPGLGAAGAASIMVTRWPEESWPASTPRPRPTLAACRRWCARIRNVRSEYDVPAAAALRPSSARVSLPRSCRRACR
jgi:valyl-tRNA synthetase